MCVAGVDGMRTLKRFLPYRSDSSQGNVGARLLVSSPMASSSSVIFSHLSVGFESHNVLTHFLSV